MTCLHIRGILLTLCLAPTALSSLHPECEFIFQLEKDERNCLQYITEHGNSSTEGCRPFWDAVVCWPHALIGEIVHRACPAVFSLFKNNTGSVSRNCTSGGWSRPSSPYHIACSVDDDIPEVRAAGARQIKRQRNHTLPTVKLIYTIGYSISLVVLAAAVLILLFFRRLRCARNFIHIQLFITFILKAVSVFIKDATLFSSDDTNHCTLSTVNFMLFINIIRILIQKLNPRLIQFNNSSQYRRLTKSTLLLIPLFGTHYMFFNFLPDYFNVNLRLCIELCMGSFQGLLVAILYCFLNQEVQKEVHMQWLRWQERSYGNQVMLENGTGCACPSGMVIVDDNCTCPLGFTLETAAGCKGEKEQSQCFIGDVDECSFEELCRRELGNVCVNTPGSFVCQCQPGFRAQAPACVGPVCPDYNVCQDVDECAESPAVCDGQGVCENTLGSYKCVCRPGYRGNGTHCEDENECASGVHRCDTNARCGNIIGSYFCQCYQGFNGDGHSCFDVDECAVNNGHCEHNCSNELGAYRCQCASGYQLIQDGHNCTDVDECVALNGTCEHICINTQGSFQCSCRPGYQLHIDGHTCVDIDECKLQNGGCSHTCSNSPGGHTCHCPPPLLLDTDNLTCSNITSCKLRNGGCDHVCTVRADGQVQCNCQAGWELGKDLRSCVDMNECKDFTNGGCEQLCVNHPGGFNCTCRKGYTVRTDDLTKCQPVCDPPCHNYGVCVAPNTCDCPPGYPGLGCSAMCSPPCAHGGTCMRWNKCLCPPGWTGPGCHTAVCELPCANGGRCVGPDTCQCPSDYIGPQCLLPLCTPACQNGGRCVDVNKCICVDGWKGARCQIEPVQCQKPCKNGGVCVGLNRCRCAKGFTGNICETAVTTPCVPPCQHGATCSPHNTCTCPEGTAGLRCERLTCPVVTTVVSMARAVRKAFRESYVDRCGPLGVQLCTKYRINQARVYLQAYRVGYKIQCPERKGR
ncbi:Signal peptide, CUB and EGF-like domain-containing protein 1 [Larimichthys crocea]|uniref:Uncharacterized protein n=1 Tax=Larimichthys crocea TaxID=215358 RepID=A0ACD3RLW0_LARCR|nr:Signal peptide, CUB and EGF-like domain-containing protein 1 [Larimichthys crocea]